MLKDGQSFLPLYEESKWRAPEAFPTLGRIGRLGLDCESTGLAVHGVDVPVGLAVHLEDNRSFYFPWGHEGGGNLDKQRVIEWANRELRGKDVVVAEGKFDLSMLRKVGIDLEALGCRLHEVQFKAALLDEYRRSFKLEDMSQDMLGVGKAKLPRGHLYQLPASQVGPYAERDACLTFMLDQHMEPAIQEQGLGEVLRLENDLIYPVVEMERNGAPIDVPRLKTWNVEVVREFQRIILDLYNEFGIKVNPNAAVDLERLFKKLGIEYGYTQKSGKGSFTDEFLRQFSSPPVAAIRKARTLDSLRSKYLQKYLEALDGDLLRYKLHQLKGDDYGTVSGRFSSSSVNIQQVFDPERQADKLGESSYIIRELFIPPPGRVWVKADASQIEFRLFAHYSNSRQLINAYVNDPTVDFHNVVAGMMGLKRKRAKGLNFGKLYAMGRDKMASQLGIGRSESDELFDQYDATFPEAKTLLARAMELAEKRGFVKTLLGRRARFPQKDRLHSSLNRVIQGSAADVMKLKLLEVYRYRKELDLTMRFTVHDELDGDLGDPAQAARLKELLESPILNIKVPLIWDVQLGPNWATGTKI